MLASTVRTTEAWSFGSIVGAVIFVGLVIAALVWAFLKAAER